MRHVLIGRHSGPFVALGGLVAVACLVSIWYINRLQSELARAVRSDAARMEAADDLQVQLRHLRVHSLVLVADPSDARRDVVRGDLTRVDAALASIRQGATAPADGRLADRIERDYSVYRANLGLDRLPLPPGPMSRVAEWSDAHHMGDLLIPCRELADLQRERMHDNLARSEAQTPWAGRLLLVLGLAGVLGGLVSGYATARGLNRQVAQLSVRVQAVQAHLDQEVGAVTVHSPGHLGALDAQLDVIVERVRAVCRRLQEQERELLRAEQLAAVGRLAAGVAHEVRNPLTGVKLLLQAATRPAHPTPLTEDRLHLLLEEVARIERTVQGLVDFARTPPLDRRCQDVRAVAAAAGAIVRSRAEPKSVRISTVAPPEPVPACVDYDQVLSLLTNLLVNAIEAVHPGGEVGITVAVGPGGRIQVEVCDNGPGIDPAVAPRLFAPFATTKPTGTGLGLALARQIARSHGGTLTGANLPGSGARFTLTLPPAEDLHAQSPGR